MFIEITPYVYDHTTQQSLLGIPELIHVDSILNVVQGHDSGATLLLEGRSSSIKESYEQIKSLLNRANLIAS